MTPTGRRCPKTRIAQSRAISTSIALAGAMLGVAGCQTVPQKVTSHVAIAVSGGEDQVAEYLLSQDDAAKGYSRTFAHTPPRSYTDSSRIHQFEDDTRTLWQLACNASRECNGPGDQISEASSGVLVVATHGDQHLAFQGPSISSVEEGTNIHRLYLMASIGLPKAFRLVPTSHLKSTPDK